MAASWFPSRDAAAEPAAAVAGHLLYKTLLDFTNLDRTRFSSVLESIRGGLSSA
jgi:hypothetical protein